MSRNRRETARVRKASHAGSWYTNNGNELNGQLSGWLSEAQALGSPIRALIAPHAGYYYCGACSAHAYRQIDPTRVKCIFILGPSHHVRLSGCALTATEKYNTPFYDLTVDDKINQELNGAGPFDLMSIDTDEDEHSIEMQLPYIAKAMERSQQYRAWSDCTDVQAGLALYCWQSLLLFVISKRRVKGVPPDVCPFLSRKGYFTIVPVLVGSLTPDKEQMYGRIFSRYLADPENLFVISSDFCHWGQRFNYTYVDKSFGDIWKSIENLDKMGMEKIMGLDSKGFTEYLKQYQNTICGRYPIGVLLHTIDAMRKVSNGYKLSFKFLNYSQSNKCFSMRDSSVSYAAGVLTMD